jgi:hypothetical protein
MKKISFIIICLSLAIVSQAQLKSKTACASFEVDVLDGRVNGYKANAPAAQIKNMWPCFTSADADSAKCGEALYYKDKGITFYTTRDYIEIVEGFKGKLSVPLMGAGRGVMFKHLGNPKVKDADWEGYQTSYGCLVLYYNKANKVRKIQMSTQNTSTISLCE